MTPDNGLIPVRGVRLGTDPDGIDDATEVYGDGLTFDIHNCSEPCDRSPSGQCEYTMKFHNWARCIHCGNPSRLDR